MFKRGKSYIYRDITIKYKKKNGQYFADVPTDTGESKRVYTATVMQMITILDTSC